MLGRLRKPNRSAVQIIGDVIKAAVIKEPNGDVHIEERDCPSPRRSEVLIRVHACGVCHGDLMLQQGLFPFASFPIVPGHEIAGVIEEIGEDSPAELASASPADGDSEGEVIV